MSEWRPVPGWEGYYNVSDAGEVSSLPRTLPRAGGRPLVLRGRLLRPSVNRDGYLSVALCRDDKRQTVKVHRLVLLAFVGPCPEGMEACHYDGERQNNSLNNLRWDTRSANTFDRVRHGTHHKARVTHCPQGHPYDEVNTYRDRTGKRSCRTCAAARKLARKMEAAA